MTPTLYRLYTEALPVAAIVSRYFDGFTVLAGDGYWKGVAEDSVVIEIIATDSGEDLQRVVNLAGDIKFTNRQQTVLVTWQAINRLDV